jgi:dipeptidyl aminopeptidase/acylaminoacyl peptidase
MPWEGSELVVAEIALSESTLRVTNAKVVAGRKGDISVGQPQWASSDTLVFLNDVSGYVNPWLYSASASKAGPLSPEPIVEDFSEPAWRLGWSDYAILDSNTVLFASTRDGRSILSLADLRSHSLKSVATPYSIISQLRTVSSNEGVFLCKKDDEADAAVTVTVTEGGEPKYNVVKSTSTMLLPNDIISKGQSYSLPVPPSNEPVHVLFYAPFNPRFVPLDGEVPPAVVSVHGGPTARAPPGLDWAKQFWTSRGWAW